MQIHSLALLPLLALVPSPTAQTPANAAFESLFDGRTLQGWVTQGGRYDGNARWTVEDGFLTGREGPDRGGGLIYTERAYTNFVFECDVRIDYPFDSGIFLRMVPPGGGRGAQVTLDYRSDGEVAAIYADGFLLHNQEGKEKFRRDQWNRVRVRCIGRDMHIQVWLNGELVTDFQMPEGTEGYAPTGLIGLQVHGNRNDPEGSKAQFRNIRISELPDYDASAFTTDDAGFLRLTEEGAEQGWGMLFNGEDLTGWETEGGEDGYVVEDGLLVFPVSGSGGYIRTAADFRDFELRMDFKIARMANSGLFLRGDREGGDPAYSGCEVQILDDFNWESVTGSALQEWQFTGSLYASVPPGERAMRPLGTWNTLHVLYSGSRLKVQLNGTTLYDVDTYDVPVAYANQPAFRDRAAAGFIGLQRHAPREATGEAFAWFKNIFVRPFD